VPSPGHEFIDADYKTIELATLAQACVGQFGLESSMATAINADKDLHTLFAAKVAGKDEADVTKDERTKVKPINFGKPGGMGDKTMQQYAKASYGVDLTDTEVAELTAAWFDMFPEMTDFPSDSTDAPLELAKFLDLTLESHFQETGDSRFLMHQENVGRERAPNFILGCMCLKAIKTAAPATRAGKPYSEGDVAYFWSRLKANLSSIPSKFHSAILQCQPSVQLQRAILGLVGRAGVFTLTGRLRAKASYCARHNTVFQGLAADGAKLALWLLWRAGYRLVNFVHDEVLVEVPIKSDLKHHAERIRALMMEGMRQVVPDIKIDVSYSATRRWRKDAEAVFVDGGSRLIPWEPKKKALQKSCKGRSTPVHGS
jgi:DNA polymerase family A